ncbi:MULTISPECIES: 2-hydroxychromene-2-carboxylate isomerase [unclassified Cupriavidus]|uniref:2-hydroxychromene-2-carboxylate isomerase n=1 Tax=unclassified Cupriavidus TaxID=2640874 RepID=UPI001C004F49|nr:MULTISPECIES: 2-hydroxychromene-2-carboxylate isomerase [unclassified Cupriavidus]MCA3186505.1 2-hydroxychromene-2-carboxylate isomerase [Cupriavidus sp.]MCA3188984.1 2-hydroxychromene-2-carboxylate isomerase [Cupriavidus sp.]MCA3198703.1 2-hydroxychromene-2-carboxylate isomerase [Cupriavidus sp.]MCA3201449.1 2-hydroxychromene-2-carboxylate isomerase [Cupriavidus sp.]MCA3208651.1 2-hydroxychromene-2-carboxylate isomerase [Cupriavidus sp.]
MTRQVEFFFDFGSPYSYLAYKELPRVAARTGATIVWRPMLLGGVFKATGNHSPMEIPAKRQWSDGDLDCWARRYGAPFRLNPHFPINTLALMRGAIGYQRKGEAEFHRYVDAIFTAMWETGRNLNDPVEIGKVLVAAGLDPREALAMLDDAEVKADLKRVTEEAVARGIFGAPSFIVGDKLYWGNDRLLFVEEQLAG